MIPYLENCSQSQDGWCLECVKELYLRLNESEIKNDELVEEINRIKDGVTAFLLEN